MVLDGWHNIDYKKVNKRKDIYKEENVTIYELMTPKGI